ncbi:MAG: CvpA family protein [Clostridia bacterium]|nr:CvpA family protein [Clostridia bacterium]
MSILDIVFLVILFIAFISGMQKGLITSFLACAAMLGAFFIAMSLEGRLASSFMDSSFRTWLAENFTEEGQAIDFDQLFHALSFVIVFILAYAALMLIVNLINNVVRMPKLKAVDSLLGGLLGLVRGYVVICITVAVIKIIFKPLESEGTNFVQNLIDDSAIATFFSTKSLGDIFGISKMITELK